MDLHQRIGVPAHAVQTCQQSIPRILPIRMFREHLRVERIGLLQIVALEINPRKLKTGRHGGLLPRGGLPCDRLIQNLLRHIKTLLRLIHESHRQLKAGLPYRLRVTRGRHGLQRLERLLILLHGMLSAHQPLPCRSITPILGQNLKVEARRLLQMIRLLEQSGGLQLRSATRCLRMCRLRCNLGRLRMDRLQTVQICPRQHGVPSQLRRTCKSPQRLGIVRV